MRSLVRACVLVACLVACDGGRERITEVESSVGGVYSLRQMNDASLPLYFSPWWYPGQGSSPGSQSSTLVSANLALRPDGTFTWSTLLEEVALRPDAPLPDYVFFTVRREASGNWSRTSSGVVSLEGIDQFGAYVLTGSMTSTGLTLSSTFASRQNSTFVLER